MRGLLLAFALLQLSLLLTIGFLTFFHNFAVAEELRLDIFLLAGSSLHEKVFAKTSAFRSALWGSGRNRLVGGCEASSLSIR